MHPYTLLLFPNAPLYSAFISDYDQTEEKGCRFRTFDCEDKGVYTHVHDRSLSHEERVQICTLILGLVEGGGFEPPKSTDGRFTVCSL